MNMRMRVGAGGGDVCVLGLDGYGVNKLELVGWIFRNV